MKFKELGEWTKKSGTIYAYAVRFGWLNDIKKKLICKTQRWTLEKCLSDSSKYSCRSQWERNSGSAYQAALRNGWLDLCFNGVKRNTGPSLGEKEILSSIKLFYPEAASQWFSNKKIKIGNRFQLDVYVPHLKKGIEFNGTYHHSTRGLSRGRPSWPISMILEYDKIKQSFFNDLDISYLIIKEEDWKKNKKECTQKALAFLGSPHVK